MRRRSVAALARCCLLVSILAATISLTVQAKDHCLAAVKGPSVNPRFDVDHDLNAQGDSFSCDVEVRASTALSVLEAFRYGFLYDSRAHLDRSIQFPLKVTVARSDFDPAQVLLIKDVPDWLKFKARHFNPYERAMIACANLANVRIFKKWSGFSIGSGRVWFFNSVNFGLKVGQINVAPMGEELFLEACVADSTGK